MTRTHLMTAGAFALLAADTGAGSGSTSAPSSTAAAGAAAAAADSAAKAAEAAGAMATPPASEANKGEQKNAKKGAKATDDGTIFVACKLPHGLDLGNGIVLKGANDRTAQRANGFGITSGVDGAAFAEWLRTHPDNVAVKNGLIFSDAKVDKLVGEAREKSGVKTGFEQLGRKDVQAIGVEEVPEAAEARQRNPDAESY